MWNGTGGLVLFKVGDRIVHPLHGAGVIDKIDKTRENGSEKDFYVLKFFSGDMSVRIPAEKSADIGLRPIISKGSALKILNAFPDITVQAGDSNWNRRYRENMDRIRSGDPMEVASVVKNLMARDQRRGLSTGERRMLHFAKDILVSEMTMSMDMPEGEIEDKLALAVG